MTHRRIATAILLLALACLWFSGRAWAASDAVDIRLCELLDRPLDFANKRVRLTGALESGLEYFGLNVEECHSAIRVWVTLAAESESFQYARGWTTKDFIKALSAGELRGAGPKVQWQSPAPVTPFAEEQGSVISRSLDHHERVILTGRFDYAGDGLLIRDKDGHFSVQSAYGHLNCCQGQFVVETVTVAGE